MIRKFEEKDLNQTLKLCNEVRQYHIELLDGYFTKQDDIAEQIPFLDSLRNKNTIALISENNNKIDGYLLATIKKHPFLLNPKIAFVSNLGVSKEHQNNGIGKSLFKSFLDICKKHNIDEIRLNVFNQNKLAYEFYKNLGFKSVEQRMSFKITNHKTDIKNKNTP